MRDARLHTAHFVGLIPRWLSEERKGCVILSVYSGTIGQRGLLLVNSSNYKWWAFAAIGMGTFSSVADMDSVLVALPSISEHFQTELPTTQWVVIAYALTTSALLLPMGRLSDIVGRKPVYVAGFAFFILGAALAGTSTTILVLTLGRVVQGAGAAMTQGTGMAMILSTFPSAERGKALGLLLSVVGAGAVAGPAMGGLLVSALGWRSVFFGSMALATLSIIPAVLVLENRRPTEIDGRTTVFDWPGAALSTGALVSFLVGMTAGPRVGWISPMVVGTMVLFAVLLGAFILWELRVASPMMDLRLFKRRLFALGVSASFISFLGNGSVRFLMPFYLQAVLGYTPGQIGLIFVPSAVAMVITGPLSGRFSDRYGWRIFNVGGLLLSVTGLFMLSALNESSSLGFVMAGLIIQVSGNGVFSPPNNSSILSSVESSKYGVVSGFLNLVRNSANVTSTALATAIVTATMASMGFPATLGAISEADATGISGAFTSGLRLAFLIMGGVLFLAIAASMLKGGRLDGAPAQRTEPSTAGGEAL